MSDFPGSDDSADHQPYFDLIAALVVVVKVEYKQIGVKILLFQGDSLDG